MKKNPRIVLGAVCLSAICMGCGSDAQSTAFHDEMERVYEGLTDSVNTLEAIDPSSENAEDQILGELDEMSELFERLSNIEVPPKMADRVGNVDELADDAAAYMKEASRLYHNAWHNAEYDGQAVQAAQENYTRAMERVNYIAILLQGRVPEGDNITVIPEEENAN